MYIFLFWEKGSIPSCIMFIVRAATYTQKSFNSHYILNVSHIHDYTRIEISSKKGASNFQFTSYRTPIVHQ
nr:hypothetical protein CFP56_44826 [Quercus suber]